MRLLTEVAGVLHPEMPVSTPRASLYDDLMQLSREMAHRAEVLETRRVEAHKTLDHLGDEDESAT